MEPATAGRRSRTSRLGLVAGAVGASVLVVAVASLVSREPVAVGKNVFVNRGGPIDATNSPTVVRNPLQPQNLVSVSRVDRPGFSAGLQRSNDGGQSWQPSALPLPDGVPPCAGSVSGERCPFAPDASFGPDGTLYAVYVNLEGSGNVPANLWLSTSSDGGRTMAPPTRVSGRLTFQPRTIVDRAGTVHITWLQANEVGLLRLVGTPSPVVAVHSTDAGRTFSSPAPVSDPQRERVGAATPVVDSNGELVVLYQDFKADRRDFENLEGPPWSDPFALVVTRSKDGGKTFSSGVEIESGVVPTRRFLVFLPEFPSLAAGPGGTLYAAWTDGRNGDEDVYLRRSSKGGRQWAPPVRVNSNRRGDGTSQYLPRVDVAPDGRVDVVFLDRRRDRQDVRMDAFLAFSDDGGRSFENLRISSTSFDSRVGPTVGPQFGTDFGSRLGLASGSGRIPTVAVWTDTRLGTDVSGRQDIVAVRVEVAHQAWFTGRLVVVAGLVVVLGLLALVRWRRAIGRGRQ